MKRWIKRVITIVVVLAIVVVMGRFAYIRYKDKISIIGKKKIEKLNLATPVAVYKARTGSMRDLLVLNGGVFPETEVNIFSTVPGKIKSIMVTEGSFARKGSVLAYIDRSEAGLVFAPTPVDSTINGIVKKVMIERGAYISPQMPLFQIIDMNTVDVIVHIPEVNIYKIKRGLQAEIKLVSYPDKMFFGRIVKISPVVDPLSRTLEVKIRISNKNHIIKPGMFGEVKIIIKKTKNVMIVPFSAIVNENGKDVLFIVKGGKAQQVEAKIGIQEGDKISILSGVKTGDDVIVVGQQNVHNGDRVNIVEVVE